MVGAQDSVWFGTQLIWMLRPVLPHDTISSVWGSGSWIRFLGRHFELEFLDGLSGWCSLCWMYGWTSGGNWGAYDVMIQNVIVGRDCYLRISCLLLIGLQANGHKQYSTFFQLCVMITESSEISNYYLTNGCIRT
jgi:hypothetical protein